MCIVRSAEHKMSRMPVFCRACGLDLSTIARVMEKHLPLALLEKIDEQILNPKKSELYNSFLAGLLTIVLLVIGFGLSGWNYPNDATFFFHRRGILRLPNGLAFSDLRSQPQQNENGFNDR